MRRLISLIVALVILFSVSITAGADEFADSSEWITLSFITEYTGAAENKIMLKWDWNDLLENASTSGANADLAVAGMALSSEIEISRSNIETALKAFGFTDVLSDYYESGTEHKNGLSNPARTFAHHEITVNGETKHIICAVFRGTKSTADTNTDVKSLKDGFLDAGKNCAESLKQYQSTISGATKENTVLFLTGHSLGASMSSLVACLCDDIADRSATHTYSFATPNYDTMGLKTEDYQNVHHYINVKDAVPTMPANYGKTGDEIIYSYDSLTDAEKARFERVYKFLRNVSYEKDDKREDPILGDIKEHMGYTYMSFMLCKLTDEEIDSYIAPFEIVKYNAELKSLSQNAKGSVKAQSAACSVCQKPNYEFSINKNGKWETTTSESGKAAFKKLSDGKSYSVKVRIAKTINGAEYFSPWSSEQKIKIDNTPYKLKEYKPVIKGVKKGNKKVTVTAKACKLCEKPVYRFAIKKNGKWVSTETTSKSAVFKKLAKKKTYKVKVRITKKIGGKTYCSKWSAVKSVKL